jgi:hypothetical protein
LRKNKQYLIVFGEGIGLFVKIGMESVGKKTNDVFQIRKKGLLLRLKIKKYG